MIKKYYELYSDALVCYYKNIKQHKDKRFGILYLALNPFEDTWIECEEIEREGIVEIFSRDDFKSLKFSDSDTYEESIALSSRYQDYYDKRELEIPKTEMSIPDWHVLQEKWKKIKEKKPTYVIFELDDSGPLDKVNVYGKQELTQEDLDYIEKEHKKYLKYKAAEKKYAENHPDYSPFFWRGPQDDEYEADIMQYYDDSDES